MQLAAAPRLERHRIFHSHDVEATRAFLDSKNFRVDFGRGENQPLDAHVNGVYLPGMYIGYLCYGRTTALKATPARTDYWIQLPIHKRFEITMGKRSAVCGPHRGAVLSPMNENLIRSEPGCGRLVFSLTGTTVVRQLATLLGQALHAPLEFADTMDLTTGYGQSVLHYMRAAVHDLEQSDSLLRSPMAMSSYEQFIITGLLLSHRHNYSDALLRPERRIAPRDVKRAIDYVEANLDAPISLADIVDAAGVPGRTLHKHFRHFTGASPMGYLRNARFERVRRTLLHAPAEENISVIAAKCGFDHLGRFAVEYRRRFGERPSDTRKRGREN